MRPFLRCRSIFLSGAALAAFAFLAPGCQSSGRGAGNSSTGPTSPGGKTGSGGSSGSGGVTTSLGTGGATGRGGSDASATTAPPGGGSGSGGVSATGGVFVSGGTGGVASTGGVGGALSGSGGATSAGGIASTAGSKATAGATASGGIAGGTSSGGAGGVGGKTGSGGIVVAGSGGGVGSGSGGSVAAGSGGRTGGSGGSLGWAVRMADSLIARHPDPDTVSGNHFSWETGYTMWALEKVWRSSGDPKYFAYLKKYVDQHVDASGNLTGFSSSALDNFLPGYAILLLFEETKDPRYSTAAGVIRKAFDTYPRNNSDGGFWHNTGLKGQMWVDGVFMGQMFLARYAHAVGDSTYAFGEVVKQMTDIVNHCMKANGLLLHAYDETKKASWADPTTGLAAEVWSEGLGWYTVLIADVLDYLPADHAGRPQLLDILGKLVAGLKANQDAQTGRWCQVVDKCTLTDNWNESSGTGMFLYLIKRAIDRGYVDVATYGPVVDNAYKGLVQKATVSGATVDIHDCSSIGVQNAYSDYVSKPKQVSPPSCVASFMAGTGIVENQSAAPALP
jgi:rhamnogalacturonyl hydrolase YesR